MGKALSGGELVDVVVGVMDVEVVVVVGVIEVEVVDVVEVALVVVSEVGVGLVMVALVVRAVVGSGTLVRRVTTIVAVVWGRVTTVVLRVVVMTIFCLFCNSRRCNPAADCPNMSCMASAQSLALLEGEKGPCGILRW